MTKVERIELPFEDHSSQFRVTKKELDGAFSRQYFEIYTSRLDALRPRVLEAAKAYGNVKYVSLQHLELEREVLIIGTIVKRISNRPSIIKDLASDEKVIPDDVEIPDEEITSLISSSDYLEVEDEKTLVKLNGNIEMDDVSTGCVVGLIGSQFRDDFFTVKHVVYPKANVQKPWPKGKSGAIVLMLSGLELTGLPHKDANTILAFTLLIRWLNGEMSVSKEDFEIAHMVERVIIAGNSLYTNVAYEVSEAVRKLRLVHKAGKTPTPESVEVFDQLLSKLTTGMSVDVLGGIGDPCSQMWPQQPIHRACLPKASVNGKALGLQTNPYEFNLGGFEFLVTSGQNVSDVRRMSTISDSLDVMEKMLKWQHICPTAPDTVDAVPLTRDALTLSSYPHVFVAGNQLNHGGSRMVESEDGKTLLIELPRFSRSFQVALLHLDSLDVEFRYFGSA